MSGRVVGATRVTRFATSAKFLPIEMVYFRWNSCIIRGQYPGQYPGNDFFAPLEPGPGRGA